MSKYLVTGDGRRLLTGAGAPLIADAPGDAGTPIIPEAMPVSASLTASVSGIATATVAAMGLALALTASPSVAGGLSPMGVVFALQAQPSATASASADLPITVTLDAQPTATADVVPAPMPLAFDLSAQPSAVTAAAIVPAQMAVSLSLTAQPSASSQAAIVPAPMPVSWSLAGKPSAATLITPASMPVTWALAAKISVSTGAKFRDYWLSAYGTRQAVLNAIDANNRLLARNAGTLATATADALVVTNTAVTAVDNRVTAEANRTTLLRASIGQTGDNLVRTSNFTPAGGRGTWEAGTVVAGESAGKYALQITGSVYESGATLDDAGGYFLVGGGETIDGSFRARTASLSGGGSLQFGVHSINADGSGNFQPMAVKAAGGGYSTVTGRITLPATAVKARCYVFLLGVTGNAQVADLVARRLTVAEASSATAMQVLDARVTVNEAGVTQARALHGVYLDVNGHISGTQSINDGVTSEFNVLATVFRLLSPGAGSGMEVRDGYIRVWNGSAQRIIGNGFGAGGNLMDYFGPNVGVSAASKSNATMWMDTTGSAYFGGSLSAGVLKNAAQSSAISTTASVETAVFGTNGAQKSVVLSLSYVNTGYLNGNVVGAHNNVATSATVKLYRSYAGGGWTEIATLNAAGNTTAEYDFEFNRTNIVKECGGSITYTDNQAGTGTFQYRATVVAATGNWPITLVGPAAGTQRLSVVSTEQ